VEKLSAREHAVTASELLRSIDVFIERSPAKEVGPNSEWMVELSLAHALTAIALEATRPDEPPA